MSYEERADELFALMCRRPDEPAPLWPGNGFRGQFIILRCLLEASGEMFAGDLAQALHVTTGRVATAIKRLEAMGYVTKRKGEADGRRTLITITDAGRDALLAREAHIRGFLTERLRRLSEAEAAEYVRLMQKMR